jgi:hypothetical protein
MSKPSTKEIRMTSKPAESAAADLDRGQVEALAYQLWIQRGSPEGSPEIDWLQAEADLKNRSRPIQEAA